MPSVSISLPVLRCIYKGPARLSTLIPDGDGGWLNAMPLDGDDIIYFSPFQPDPAAPYLSIARAEGIDAPDDAFMATQRQRIIEQLTLPPPPAGPKRVPYNLADFVY